MLIKALGAIDVLAGLILIINTLINMPDKLLIALGIMVAAKSLLGALKDFASWIDLLTGVVLFVSAYLAIPPIIAIIFAIAILQKGVFSFLD